MFIRRIVSCGVLVVGAALFSTGCKSTADARNTPGEQAGAKCTGNEPGYNYTSREPAQCRATLFTCPTDFTPFFNDCGCGCKPAQ